MTLFKYLFFYISIVLLFTSCALILNFQDLPIPDGKYIVGTELFDWEDTYRTGLELVGFK